MLEQNTPPLSAEVGKMTAGARCIKLETLDSCGDGHMALFRDGGSSSQAETPGSNLLDAVEAPPLGNLATDAQVHSAVVSGSTSSSAGSIEGQTRVATDSSISDAAPLGWTLVADEGLPTGCAAPREARRLAHVHNVEATVFLHRHHKRF